jgi:hypothetical protein
MLPNSVGSRSTDPKTILGLTLSLGRNRKECSVLFTDAFLRIRRRSLGLWIQNRFMKGMEMAYVHFEPQRRSCFYAWRSLKLLDIEMFGSDLEIDRCPFAAIIDLADEVPKTKTFSLSAFPFNSGLTVQQNIKTRLGILANKRRRSAQPAETFGH